MSLVTFGHIDPFFSRPVVELGEAVAFGAVVLVSVGIGGYVLGSFMLMGRHVSSRRLGTSLRALLRELWVAIFTQPLLPLFYLFGERLAPAPIKQQDDTGAKGHVPVVFVHGYMQNRVGFLGLSRSLQKRGLGPLYGFNYPWFTSIASNAKRLDRYVARVCKETGSSAVDLVCHSMGGLVAMEMMRDEARREKLAVRRCITIATPHAGVMWKGPLIGFGATNLRRGSKLLEAHAGAKVLVPCLSIYSSHDNVVHPKESSSLALRGGRDVEVDGLAHLAILFAPEVADHVIAFLLEPEPLPILDVPAPILDATSAPVGEAEAAHG